MVENTVVETLGENVSRLSFDDWSEHQVLGRFVRCLSAHEVPTAVVALFATI
jgi:hypothetical protein